jgi:hypothetical protein
MLEMRGKAWELLRVIVLERQQDNGRSPISHKHCGVMKDKRHGCPEHVFAFGYELESIPSTNHRKA